MAAVMLTSSQSLKYTVAELSRKILLEMRELSSAPHDSILRDTVEAVKNFHWDTVLLKYKKMIPTLVMLLEALLPKRANTKPLICFVASLLVKSRHQRLCLVQRAVSVMLYGNGSSKQVRIRSFLLHQVYPLLCSYTAISNHSMYVCRIKGHYIINKLSEDYDIEVQFWADEIVNNILTSPVS